MVSKINVLVGELTNLMLNLDDANFDKITANVMNVQQLSAITANMGKLTSGEIYGAYIATADGVYPRAEMSNTLNLFAAYAASNKSIQIKALDGTTSAPTILLQDTTVPLTVLVYLDPSLQEFNIGSTRNTRISSGLGGYTRLDGVVRVGDWTKFERITPSQTLQQALDAKANSFSGFTGTIYVSTTSGGPATTPKTFSNGVCTS